MDNFTVNREKKTFVFDDGEELPIPKDKVKQVLRSPAAKKSKQEAIDKWKQWDETVPAGDAGHSFINNLSESTFGNPGDTLANYAVSGYKALSSGEGQEEMGYIDRLLDHFYAMQEGRKEHLAEQSAKSPNAALAGQITGMGAELGTLHGVPAMLALPAMGAGHSETSFLEPSEKIPELAQEAVIGGLVDKFFGAASKVAGHRATRRGIQDAIRTTEEANAEAIQNATRATEADAARFAQESAAREAEVGRLPQLQQVENEAFVNSSAQRVDRVAKTMGNTPVTNEVMGVEPFIEQFIESSVHAGTKEGGRVSKFLRSAFKGNEKGKLTGENISRGMKAVDEMIAKESGAVREMLTEFKTFVAEELPSKVGNFMAYEKWMPKIQARIIPVIENDLASAFSKNGEVFQYAKDKLGTRFLTDMNKSLKADIDGIFASHAGNFENALADGTIGREIQGAIESNPIYQQLVDNLVDVNEFTGTMQGVPIRLNAPVGHQAVKDSIMNFPNKVAERVETITQRYLPDIRLESSTKSGITDRSLSQMPTRPNLVPEPPAVNPAQTFQPNLAPVPTIPGPQGLMQRLAYGLEGMSEQGIGGMVQGMKDNASTGLLAKMAGVPVGKIAAGVAGAVSGLSALTSPSVMGRAFRSGLEQTTRMMDAVKQRASAYPSHVGNGVLNDPMERRSLVKEIEDDLNMRLEDKAIIQSKVNRGQALIPEMGR